MADVTLDDVDLVLDHAIAGVNQSYVKRKELVPRKLSIISKALKC